MSEELADTAAASVAPGDSAVPLELPEIAVTSYELGRELGRGGMGMVLSARDRRLQRLLAVKVSKSASPSALARFAREALLTARLQHPAIVPVHEAGRLPSGDPFYAMKLVAGRSLDAVIARATELDDRLALLPRMIAVVEAMAYAHAQRVIHRDLKPANIIVGDYGETIVIDWGLAKELGTADPESVDDAPYRARFQPGMTVEGSAMGTPQYMAPEQAAGEAVDARADVYGLGAVLYHLLCGAPPYDGTIPDVVLTHVLAGPPRKLAERQPGVPADLVAIVEQAMSRDPAARYADAGALAADLERFYRGQLVAAHAYSTGELVRRWLRRHRAVISVAAIAAVALIAVGGVAVWRITRARAETQQEAAVAAQRDRTARAARAAELTEQGRQELLAGRAATAEPPLAEASRLDGDTPARHVLLGDARAQLAAEVGKLEVGAVVNALALSPDGTALLTIDDGGRARRWDIATARAIDLGPATDGVMSADGTQVALVDTHDPERHPRVWAGGQVATFDVPDRDTTQVQLSPDGRKLAAVGLSSACVFDVKTAARAWCAAVDYSHFRPAFSADGARLALDGPGETVRVHDAATGAVLETVAPGLLAAAAFDPHGALITADDQGAVEAWRDDRRTQHVWASRAAKIVGFAVSADGAHAIASFDTDPDALLARSTGEPTVLHAAPRDVRAVAITADGQRAATVGNDGAVAVWDVASGARLATVQAGVDATALAFSRDGATLAAAGADGIAHIWKVAALPLPTITRDAHAPDDTALAAFTAGRKVAYAAELPNGGGWTIEIDHHYRLWRANGEPIATLSELFPFSAVDPDNLPVTFSGDGKRMLLRSFATVAIYDTSTGTRTTEIKLDRGPVIEAAANRDASRVAIVFGEGSSPGIVRARPYSALLWDVAANAQIAALAAGTTLAQFSPRGDLLVTGHADGTARLWAAGGEPIATMYGHTRELDSVAVSRDGVFVVTAAADHTVRLWDAQSGHLLATHELRDTAPGESRAAFGPDDRSIIAHTPSGATWMWRLP